MTLSVDGAGGAQEQITIDVRGTTVSTHIRTDAQTADVLRLRTAELQDALGRHGLDGESVRVSAAARAAEDAGPLTGTEREGLKLASAASTTPDGTNTNGQQGRSAREWDRGDDARREPDARGRDERGARERAAQQQEQQDQQERQRRQTFSLGNA
jgi:hypothetical protein